MNNIIKDSPHNVYVLHSNGDEQIIYDSKTRFKVIRNLSTSVECKRPLYSYNYLCTNSIK